MKMDIRSFSLAWRWTDAKHAELPAEVLSQMVPLDATEAREIHDRWIRCFEDFGDVFQNRFASVEICPTEGTWHGDVCGREQPLKEVVRNWLREREQRLDIPVIISWEMELAISTSWGIFTEWWDDFCYPASDDAFVVPDGEKWFLAFHHEDWFTFCREPRA
jgi:hypothetical protein